MACFDTAAGSQRKIKRGRAERRSLRAFQGCANRIAGLKADRGQQEKRPEVKARERGEAQGHVI